MYFSNCLLLLGCVRIALATSSALVLHEKRDVPIDMGLMRRVSGSAVALFRIALKQRNLEHADEYLMDISQPHSPNYGKTWSAREVQKAFAPAEEAVETVQNWLADAGIDGVHERNGWLLFESSVGSIEDLLKAEYYEHEGYESKGVRISFTTFPHIFRSTWTILLPVWLFRHRNKSSQPLNANPGLRHTYDHCQSMTPACIRKVYNLPAPGEVASLYNSSGINSLGLFETSGGRYWGSDLDLYFRTFVPAIPVGTRPQDIRINRGRFHFRQINQETELDLMVAYPIIYPQTITIYKAAPVFQGRPTELYGDFPVSIQEMLDAIDGSLCNGVYTLPGEECSTLPLPRVISMSYGTAEVDQPEAYIRRQCYEFLKLGLQGTTVAVSSGDHGVASQSTYNENRNATTNGCIVRGDYYASVSTARGENGTIFNPLFPASCPYVLSVGGTRYYPGQTILNRESAMIDTQYPLSLSTKAKIEFSSSGGFSNTFRRPRYQEATVASYFHRHDPRYPYYSFNGIPYNESRSNLGSNGGVYNRAGRGIPDVSAIGLDVTQILGGRRKQSSGTSCAAPLWASIFTLINEKRMEFGKGPVGFVNPVLYEHPEIFNDVVNGTNPGCFTSGFSAVEGWDPVTGLGTPNYPKILKVFLSLP